MMELEPIVLTTSIRDQKYNDEGKKVLETTWKADKGTVFVVCILGVMKPEDVTPEFVTEKLKEYAGDTVNKTYKSLDGSPN